MVPLFIMLEHFQASTYKTDPFVSFLREYFRENICLLCARVHPMYIHDYVRRLVRNGATCQNDEIVVCVIICHIAKRNGKQYTKRLLPPFVISECNISRENVIRMYKAMACPPMNFLSMGSSGRFSSVIVPEVKLTRRILPM